jgi:hypothetical protein
LQPVHRDAEPRISECSFNKFNLAFAYDRCPAYVPQFCGCSVLRLRAFASKPLPLLLLLLLLLL